MTPVFQTRLPDELCADPTRARLPGIQPLDPDDWLQVDEAFAGQMRLRDQLIANQRDKVLALAPSALPAGQELLENVVTRLESQTGYSKTGTGIRRPDGVNIPINADDPMATLGRLVQEDLCLLEKSGTEHVLTGAILCFPASWCLGEKFMAPLGNIHAPVGEYDDDMARRVQRMFDLMRPQQPLWRSNCLFYDDPALFAPRSAGDPRHETQAGAEFVRSERQCLLKLSGTGAVVFSIHTWLVRTRNLSEEQRRHLIP